MKSVTKISLIAASLFVAGSAFAFDVPDLIRGPLSADLKLHLNTPVKVATCPRGYSEKFANEKLACERTVRQAADVQCPSGFPNYTARNGAGVGNADRDLCAKAGVNLPSTGALSGVTVGVDFVRIPLDGSVNGNSFVAGHPDAAEVQSQGWRLNTSNADASGIRDRYQRSFVVKASPILVNP
jgi:hypothetical protein